MKTRLSGTWLSGASILLVWFAGICAARAQDSWINSGSGLWRVGGNWSAGAPPGSATTLTLITNANTKTVTIDAATPAANLALLKLTVSAPPGSTNTLQLLDLGAANPFRALNTFTIDNGGTLYLTNSALVVTGAGSLNILGGAAILDSGLLEVSSVPTRVGRVTTGSLRVKTGTVQAGVIIVGEFPGSQGTLTIEGGSVALSSLLTLGDGATSAGIVSLIGGQLSVTNDITKVGNLGTGQMVVSNATATLGNVSVGRHDGASGALTVGTGGTLSLTEDLSIGRFSGSSGSVLVSGGRLAVATNNIWVGREGAGQFTVNGGAVEALGFLVAANSTNTDSGTLTVAGGTLIVSSNLVVGNAAFSAAQMSVSGGSVNVTNAGEQALLIVANGALSFSDGAIITDRLVLTNSTGLINFNGGRLETKGTVIANGAPFTVGDGTTAATLHLLGGTHSFADGLVISKSAMLTGCGTVIGTVTNNGIIATNCGAAPVAPAIVTQPASVVVKQGDAATFSVTATGDPPLAFQWRFNGGDLSAETSSTLTINNAQPANQGTYIVRVSNGAGMADSDPATLTVLVRPAITSQPQSQTATNGADVTFAVTADGSAPLNYQWSFNGRDIPGANNDTLSLTNVQPSDAGEYKVTVNNSAGSATSSAVLRVLFAPTITGVIWTGSTLEFSFSTGNGFACAIEYKTTLNEANWSTLGTLTGTGGVLTFRDNAPTSPTRFYRVRVE